MTPRTILACLVPCLLVLTTAPPATASGTAVPPLCPNTYVLEGVMVSLDFPELEINRAKGYAWKFDESWRSSDYKVGKLTGRACMESLEDLLCGLVLIKIQGASSCDELMDRVTFTVIRMPQGSHYEGEISEA